MAIPLAGKVVVITGASSGIGAATALALARHGANLILGARRAQRLETVAAQCRQAASGTPCQVAVLPCDVTRRADVKALVDAAVTRFGRLDVMIANAGYGYLCRIHETTDPDFDDIVATNVKGTLYAMQEAAAVMLPQKAGHIIVVSSAAARRGLPLYGVYSMTKAAQLSLAEAMRVELRHTGVYISTVHPISTTTEFFDVASQRSHMRTAGTGPKQSAELVARKIVRLIRKPKPELWPFSLARYALALACTFPRLGDAIMARTIRMRTPKTGNS